MRKHFRTSDRLLLGVQAALFEGAGWSPISCLVLDQAFATVAAYSLEDLRNGRAGKCEHINDVPGNEMSVSRLSQERMLTSFARKMFKSHFELAEPTIVTTPTLFLKCDELSFSAENGQAEFCHVRDVTRIREFHRSGIKNTRYLLSQSRCLCNISELEHKPAFVSYRYKLLSFLWAVVSRNELHLAD